MRVRCAVDEVELEGDCGLVDGVTAASESATKNKKKNEWN